TPIFDTSRRVRRLCVLLVGVGAAHLGNRLAGSRDVVEGSARRTREVTRRLGERSELSLDGGVDFEVDTREVRTDLEVCAAQATSGIRNIVTTRHDCGQYQSGHQSGAEKAF